MMAKTWTAGKADEDWKVAICDRDIERVEGLASKLDDILNYEPSKGFTAKVDSLRQYSGDQIADAIKAYWASSIKSLSNGQGVGFDTAYADHWSRLFEKNSKALLGKEMVA